MSEIRKIGEQARQASLKLMSMGSQQKNAILCSMADAIENSRSAIKEANQIDLKNGESSNLATSMMDRLELTDARIDSMVGGIREIVDLPDPIGVELSKVTRPNGLKIQKVSVPIGVIGFIYESRPNVTADSTSLCFKASNAIILRGGKEAFESNQVITKALIDGGMAQGMPEHAVQIVKTIERDAVRELVQLEGLVDMVIPRGGEGLIRAVSEQARVPVLKHYKGVCHVYVDKEADLEMAKAIIENAKCQRPGVCNSIETLLVHSDHLKSLVAKLPEVLPGVEVRGDERVVSVVPTAKAVSNTDWDEEYLDLVLAVKVVDDIDSAIAHINKHGSMHTEAIVTSSEEAAKKFRTEVDAATVCTNASTRFADGGEFGMGAEIGISTDKLHARGPMGINELTTYKFLVEGEGQIRS